MPESCPPQLLIRYLLPKSKFLFRLFPVPICSRISPILRHHTTVLDANGADTWNHSLMFILELILFKCFFFINPKSLPTIYMYICIDLYLPTYLPTHLPTYPPTYPPIYLIISHRPNDIFQSLILFECFFFTNPNLSPKYIFLLPIPIK